MLAFYVWIMAILRFMAIRSVFGSNNETNFVVLWDKKIYIYVKHFYLHEYTLPLKIADALSYL